MAETNVLKQLATLKAELRKKLADGKENPTVTFQLVDMLFGGSLTSSSIQFERWIAKQGWHCRVFDMGALWEVSSSPFDDEKTPEYEKVEYKDLIKELTKKYG